MKIALSLTLKMKTSLNTHKFMLYNRTYFDEFQEFKKLVEDLLGELMSELGVTEEQFMDACDKASENQLHKKIVD